jgi:Kef-type K+ transport system membrane component KefB
MIDAPSGPAWNLFVVLVVVVAAPLLAERVRIPGVVGLIFGGFAIGPHALDLVGNDEVLANGGTVGVLYLMFLAGLELDLALFARVRRNAVMFGLITFTAPFVLGLLSGLIDGYGTGAIVLIGSLWASHTLVTYPIVRRHGLSANRAVATTVGATVITDTMALLVLAVVVGIHTGSASGPVLAGELLLGLAILLGACFLVLPVAARWFFKGVGHERTSRYIFVLAAFLGAAALADAVGIEGIVGAFFAGLALNRLVPNRSPLMERVEFFGAAFFIPVFLVSVGLLIVPGVVADGSTLGLAGLFLTAVIAGKLGAAIAARRLFAYSGAETGVVFGLSVSQAAATLAATIVGFQAGVLDGRVVNAAVVVIVCSLLIAAVATNRAAARVTPETTGEDGALGRAIVVPLAGEDDLAPCSSSPRASPVDRAASSSPSRWSPRRRHPGWRRGGDRSSRSWGGSSTRGSRPSRCCGWTSRPPPPSSTPCSSMKPRSSSCSARSARRRSTPSSARPPTSWHRRRPCRWRSPPWRGAGRRTSCWP